MAETKRKSRDEAKGKKNKKSKKIGDNRKRRGGVGLPSKMRKELDRLNPNADNSDVAEDIDPAEDVYEYEEGLAQEDSKRNRRFDAVENLEYKLPNEFEVCFCYFSSLDYLLLWNLFVLFGIHCYTEFSGISVNLFHCKFFF